MRDAFSEGTKKSHKRRKTTPQAATEAACAEQEARHVYIDPVPSTSGLKLDDIHETEGEELSVPSASAVEESTAASTPLSSLQASTRCTAQESGESIYKTRFYNSQKANKRLREQVNNLKKNIRELKSVSVYSGFT